MRPPSIYLTPNRAFWHMSLTWKYALCVRKPWIKTINVINRLYLWAVDVWIQQLKAVIFFREPQTACDMFPKGKPSSSSGKQLNYRLSDAILSNWSAAIQCESNVSLWKRSYSVSTRRQEYHSERLTGLFTYFSLLTGSTKTQLAFIVSIF